MAVSERREGPTPAGGAYEIIYYQDDDGNPVDKEQAVAGELIEYDANGKHIMRTYFEINAVADKDEQIQET